MIVSVVDLHKEFTKINPVMRHKTPYMSSSRTRENTSGMFFHANPHG